MNYLNELQLQSVNRLCNYYSTANTVLVGHEQRMLSTGFIENCFPTKAYHSHIDPHSLLSQLHERCNTELVRTMAQAIRRRPLKAEALVCARVIPCAICGRQIALGVFCLKDLPFFPPI